MVRYLGTTWARHDMHNPSTTNFLTRKTLTYAELDQLIQFDYYSFYYVTLTACHAPTPKPSASCGRKMPRARQRWTT